MACGAAWGHCSSDDPAAQMRNVVAGLDVLVSGITWGGTKYPAAIDTGLKDFEIVANNHPQSKIFFAGQSAGAWLAAIVAVTPQNKLAQRLAGAISFYGPLDLPTLWQREQWGKINSPRGPIIYAMPGPSPFGQLPGCDNCNDAYPAGDAWFWNVTNESDTKNDPHMTACSLASPYHYFTPDSPAMFITQGSEDGIIGQYHGVSQARRMYNKLHGRPQDFVLECPGLAHGYRFDSSCTESGLRAWINATLHS